MPPLKFATTMTNSATRHLTDRCVDGLTRSAAQVKARQRPVRQPIRGRGQGERGNICVARPNSHDTQIRRKLFRLKQDFEFSVAVSTCFWVKRTFTGSARLEKPGSSRYPPHGIARLSIRRRSRDVDDLRHWPSRPARDMLCGWNRIAGSLCSTQRRANC
jgi:hypothetical protein